jgi:hypothetical protein
VVEVPDSPKVSVCVSSVAAINAVDCRLDAVVHDDKSDADNCWLASPGWLDSTPTIVLVTTVVARVSLPTPFRSKKFDAMIDWLWNYLRWACEVA